MKKDLKKVLILGSGPIIIGQAAEFDYSGTQACKALKEEGIEIVLVNSNPATIMTDTDMADKVYIEPLTTETVEKIIKEEKPDGILAGFGGQTALNLAMKLCDEGILDKYSVKLLGINSEAIKKSEDREEFKELMIEIGESVPESVIANSFEECMEFAKGHDFPIIIRPAYTLGGSGGGIASNQEEFEEICKRGLEFSPISQVLVEVCIAGWKEIEYEVIRDAKDNCIIICNMENIDPVGVHTGDSIVVAPSQTLTEKEYQMLRNSAIKIVRALKIEGGCNVQFALNPFSSQYNVIEVNPRVSRSSALASKAAGYPIAKIAAKIAVGYSLDELKNSVTENSSACFEPVLDYVVVKIPKWPFEKFATARRVLGTQMKATGEAMAIGRSFESALLKAATCIEGKLTGLRLQSLEELKLEELNEKIAACDDQRIFLIAEALRKGENIENIYNQTKIDRWFLNGINNIVSMEKKLSESYNPDVLREAELMGFTDAEILHHSRMTLDEISAMRKNHEIYPVYKMVDTCSGEFEAKTPYFYSCYEDEDESIVSSKEKVVVIGSGPVRIGQGVEFDYCCVHGAWAIREADIESIIINNNPETVSTDFDTADKLYFESLYIDDVMNVIRKEKPIGVIVQFGGQTSVNLAEKLHKAGVKILGTSFDSIDIAENRDRFREFIENLSIPVPMGCSAVDTEKAVTLAEGIGYPVIVRPSYVIGGRGMRIIRSNEELDEYLEYIKSVMEDADIIIDKYIEGTEFEVDAVCDGDDILIPGIMEHVERTGIHSGDSISVYPPPTLCSTAIEKAIEYTEAIAKGLKAVGLINIQFVYDGSEVHIIEVNPRASRTVPILSKVTGVPMIKLAVDAMLGKKLKASEYGTGLRENMNFYAVKVPVFSMEKLDGADFYLGPEMKSTGEALGIDRNLGIAFLKGFLGAGISIPSEGGIYVSLKDIMKKESLKIIEGYSNRGFKIYSSPGTGKFLEENSVQSEVLDVEEALEKFQNGNIKIVINVPTEGNDSERDGFRIRRKAAEHRISVFTSIDTAEAFLDAIDASKDVSSIRCHCLK